MGEGRALHGLLVCKLWGKLIPDLMCISPKASIFFQILTKALKYLDQLNAFEGHQDVPTPFGLLDGHGSRLHLPLLEYIKSITPNKQSKWIFTLRTPNATDDWQVGDICHHNGFWNMAMTVEKDARLYFKHRHAFESTDFDQCNIVPLIDRSWNKSFSIREKNWEAIIDREWFHLNRRILKGLVILKTK